MQSFCVLIDDLEEASSQISLMLLLQVFQIIAEEKEEFGNTLYNINYSKKLLTE